MTFHLHDEASAPEAAREVLAATRKAYGVIPNMERVMASAPPALKGYEQISELFAETTLTPVEREVVCQTANFENECDYCVPWHTLLSQQAGMDPHDIEALRTGSRLNTPKLEALRCFARELIHNRGKVAPADVAAFMDAGYTDAQALEVVLGLAMKLMSNYTNSIAGTPLDQEVQKFHWEKPKIKPRKNADG